MSDPKRDDTATSDPTKRTYYARAKWDGLIYRDGEGKERCPSQGHFPCEYCHRKKQPDEVKATTTSGKAGTASAIVVVELTEDQQSNMEREALERHDDEGPGEQYVYVRN